jgi:hypothetical protein
VVAEEAAVDVEVAVVEQVVAAVALASNAERKVISLETVPLNRVVPEEDVEVMVVPDPVLATNADKKVTTLVTALPSLRVETEEDVLSEDRDLELATNVVRKDITLATAPRNREVVIEVAVLSEDRDLELATNVVRKDITLATAPRNREVAIEVAVLSEDRDPELVTNVEKKDITPVTALLSREVVVLTAPSPSVTSSATPVTRWDTCLVIVLRDARPVEVVVTASIATNPDTWPETAPKVTLDPVLVEELLVDSVVTDPPELVTDVVRKVTLSLIAPSLIPEARRRPKRSEQPLDTLSHNKQAGLLKSTDAY